MTIISPSILSCDFMNIEKELKFFDSYKNIWFHLDVMDGHFVPNLTFGAPIIRMMAKLTKQPLDAHFMVTNPEFHMDELAKTSLENFTFHYEATDEHEKLLKKGKSLFKSVGISIKPKTLTSELSDEILKLADLVLVMSVEPGFGGQKFIEKTYDKISELKKRAEDLKTPLMIQVDGGVNQENAPKLISTGASNLVAGSYVFKKGPDHYLSQIESLRTHT